MPYYHKGNLPLIALVFFSADTIKEEVLENNKIEMYENNLFYKLSFTRT